MGILLALCIAFGVMYLFRTQSEIMVKPVRHQTATYPYYEIEELAEKATTIVHGTVTRRGKAERIKIPVTTEINATNINSNEYIESIETPVYIEIIEPLKLHQPEPKEILYMEEGGELATYILEPPGGSLQKGDEIIIFLNQANHSWGSLGVLRVNNGEVVVMENKQSKKYTVDELKHKLKAAVEK